MDCDHSTLRKDCGRPIGRSKSRRPTCRGPMSRTGAGPSRPRREYPASHPGRELQLLASCSTSATYPTQGPDDVCFYDPAPVCRPAEGAPFTARQVADCQQAEGQLFVYSGLSDLPPEVLRTQRVDLVSNVLRDVQTLERLRTPTVALAAWQAFVTLLRATAPKLANRMSDAAFEKALLALAQ